MSHDYKLDKEIWDKLWGKLSKRKVCVQFCFVKK